MQKHVFFKGNTGGKTTTAEYCIDRFNASSGKDYDVAAMPVSFTTRAIRDGEKEGRDYYFLSKDDVTKLEREGGITESTTIAGNIYGTLTRELDRLNKCDILIYVTDEDGIEASLPFADAIIDFSISPRRMKEILAEKGVPDDVISKRLSRTVNTNTLNLPTDFRVDDLNKNTGELVFQSILKSISKETLLREDEWLKKSFSPFHSKQASLSIAEEFLENGSALKSYEFAKNLQGYGILNDSLRQSFEGHIIRRSSQDGLEGLVSFSLSIENANVDRIISHIDKILTNDPSEAKELERFWSLSCGEASSKIIDKHLRSSVVDSTPTLDFQVEEKSHSKKDKEVGMPHSFSKKP